MTSTLYAQNIVALPNKNNTNVKWDGKERETYSNVWGTQIISNVSTPTMEVYLPKKKNANGTAVIVAPGGGMYALSIESEGRQVAKWLNKKGIAAFVLKYRLVPSEIDGAAKMGQDGDQVTMKAKQVLPLATADGLNAIDHVRKNAKKYNIDPNKIGFIGFSAGGAVTMSVTFNYKTETKPNFIVPVYAWMNIVTPYTVPEDAPKMCVVCASDDPLYLAPASIMLYQKWEEAGKTSELHMYAKGGHGFGMKTQNIPVDKWIERFYEWSVAEGITTPKKSKLF